MIEIAAQAADGGIPHQPRSGADLTALVMNCPKILSYTPSQGFLSPHEGGSCGAHAGFLKQLRELEAKEGIHPDPEVDAYLKASAVEGVRKSPVTQYMIRLLGLEVAPL